jgi:hypothetical protein
MASSSMCAQIVEGVVSVNMASKSITAKIAEVAKFVCVAKTKNFARIAVARVSACMGDKSALAGSLAAVESYFAFMGNTSSGVGRGAEAVASVHTESEKMDADHADVQASVHTAG